MVQAWDVEDFEEFLHKLGLKAELDYGLADLDPEEVERILRETYAEED